MILSGCDTTTPKDEIELMETNVVNISGVIQSKLGDEWLFLKEDSETVNVTSQKIDLTDYVGKNITATGMFSGSTLYIDKIE